MSHHCFLPLVRQRCGICPQLDKANIIVNRLDAGSAGFAQILRIIFVLLNDCAPVCFQRLFDGTHIILLRVDNHQSIYVRVEGLLLCQKIYVHILADSCQLFQLCL